MKNKNTNSKGCSSNTDVQALLDKRAKSLNSQNQITKASIPNPPMTEQIVVPPARVWNKIENILNQQDQPKPAAKPATVLSLATALKEGKKKHPMYFTTFGLTMFLCVVFVGM